MNKKCKNPFLPMCCGLVYELGIGDNPMAPMPCRICDRIWYSKKRLELGLIQSQSTPSQKEGNNIITLLDEEDGEEEDLDALDTSFNSLAPELLDAIKFVIIYY